MKLLFTLFLSSILLLAGQFRLKLWEKNTTFGQFLNNHHIDATKFYAKVDPNDLKYFTSIMAGAPYFESVKNTKEHLEKLLIPIGEEMQIYIYKDKNNSYNYSIIPIKYKLIKDEISFELKKSCYQDLKELTNNPHLATYLKKIFKDTFDFTKLQKGDKITISYEQKSINGIAWGEPKIKAVLIQGSNKEFFAILENDKYKILSNNIQTKSIKVTKKRYLVFKQPLSHMRITSKFTYKRWHPILHRFRPHLGIDFGGHVGTPIHAIADGKVIFAGWIRGYGKVVKIAHGNGLISLYAHQSKIYVKKGQKVKAYQVIGALGNTGLSTGPHLHLGIYFHGKPVNPAHYINKKIALNSTTFYKKIVQKVSSLPKALKENEKRIYKKLANISNNKPYFWKDFNATISLDLTQGISIAQKKGSLNAVSN